MKNGYLMIIVILTLSLLLTPLLAVGDKTVKDNIPQENTSSAPTKKEGEIGVYISESGETVYLSVFDYICGVVAAEMPAVYEIEALKTQAVCAYTYLCKKLKTNAEEKSYDITDDFKTDQAYIGPEKRKERWGENFDLYETKIADAVRAVEKKAITYNEEIIFAAYHAISAGKTENALNVWGGDYPYLVPVPCEGDLLAKDYLSEVIIAPADFENALKAKNAEPHGRCEEYIGALEKSDSGTVLKITLCGKEFKGSEVREMFSLRSSNFDLLYTEEKGFCFTVRGYGHGVGMSQNGANYLALSGKNYEEIIKHFYSGVEIVEYDF